MPIIWPLRCTSTAVSEDRTHDLRIMRPTRCQLRYHRMQDARGSLCHTSPPQTYGSVTHSSPTVRPASVTYAKKVIFTCCDLARPSVVTISAHSPADSPGKPLRGVHTVAFHTRAGVCTGRPGAAPRHGTSLCAECACDSVCVCVCYGGERVGVED